MDLFLNLQYMTQELIGRLDSALTGEPGEVRLEQLLQVLILGQKSSLWWARTETSPLDLKIWTVVFDPNLVSCRMSAGATIHLAIETGR